MFKALYNLNKSNTLQPDGFRLAEDDPFYDCHLIISKFLRLMSARTSWPSTKEVEQLEKKINELLKQDQEMKVRLVTAASIRLAAYLNTHSQDGHHPQALRQLLIRLMRVRLPFTETDLARIFELVASETIRGIWYWPIDAYMRQMDYLLNNHRNLPPQLHSSLTLVLESIKEHQNHFGHETKLTQQLKKRLGGSHLTAGEVWTDTILADLKEMNRTRQEMWEAIFLHASKIKAAKPNPTWLKNAEKLITEIGIESFQQSILTWLSSVGKDRSQVMPNDNANILKGLVWFCGFYNDDEVKRLLADVALGCFYKIPQHGERSRKAGNACIHVLGNLSAIGELTQLRLQVRNRRTKDLLSEALETAAEKAGITTTRLEEISVPTFDLTGPGILEQQMGDFTAELRIEGNSTTLKWRKGNGSLQKSVPVAVKRNHAAELAALKRTQKNIRKMLPAQRGRIENLLFARDQTWHVSDWQTYYLNHPLLAPIARRLIWQFEQDGEITLGIWYKDKLVDVNDRPLILLTAETTVRLWHPLGFDVGIVREWRAWLMFHEVRQPFKQAHREIYILTDAELQTETYSNRFAAHLLRQHQFNALCQERGWHYRLGGGWDGGENSVPTLYQTDWGIIAQFWVQTVHSEDWSTAYADSGVAFYISTDQVRFYNRNMDQLPLDEVPARFYSEVLRDVDLFVGVCSVGNDPNWEDRGGLPGYNDYWHSYAFGNLSVSAEIRRDLLQTLIPRLKIAPRCSFVGKFLVVQGDIRTYKIHLGSGNILMEPNDQYLCIVPDRRSTATGKANKVFLPFDGDAVTSVILSKAFLLAEDNKISDPTIARQIRKPNMY